jgi:RNA polymerase sigma factor (sigma-70 family)
MEAARPLEPDRAAELARLRPFGEAYLMRYFGEQLAHADLEDAVSEVTLRLHRQITAGRPPENLQAAFLTAARNAAIDRLRRRARKPTVEIAAAAEAPSELPAPADLAERRDLSARMREVLLRVNPRQRRALSLRFGAGMTVPEIAAEMGISLPAAKNLLARGVAQARMQLEAIEGRQLCGQMQGELRESLDRELAGTESGPLLQAHLEHCGTCRAFLRSVRRDLHSIGPALALVGTGTHFAPIDHLSRTFRHLGGLGHAALEKARLAAYRLAGLGGEATGSGALAGSGQKVAALCGAAATTTCLATGLLGPGIGALTHHHAQHPAAPRSSARVRRLSELPVEEPTTLEPVQTAEPAPPDSHTSSPNGSQPPPETEPEPSPAEAGSEQFGFESSTPPAAPAASEPSPAPAPATSSASSPSPSSSGSGGSERFGFGG